MRSSSQREWWLAICSDGGSTENFWEPCLQELGQYTPQIYFRGPKVLLCEIGNSQSLIDKDKLVAIIEQKGLSQVGGNRIICHGDPCPGRALAKAHYPGLELFEWPLEALEYLVSPYRVDELLKKDINKIILDLRALGLRKVSDFISLAPSEVGQRWSHRGLWIWQWASANQSPPPPRIQTEEAIEECYWVPEENSLMSLETLYFIAKFLFQKIEKQLLEKHYGVRSFLISLEGFRADLSSQGLLEFELVLPAINHDPSLWFLLFKEKIAQAQRQQMIPDPLETFRVQVKETIVWHGLQRDLLDPYRETKKQSLLESLARIKLRLGEEKVFWSEFQESYIPEKSWRRGPLDIWLEKAFCESWNSASFSSFGASSSRSSPSTLPSPSLSPLSLLKNDLLVKFDEAPERVDLMFEERSGLSQIAKTRYDWIAKKPLRFFPSVQKAPIRNHQLFYDHQWQSFSVVWRDIVCGEFWGQNLERHYGILLLSAGQKLWFYKEKNEIYLQGHFI